MIECFPNGERPMQEEFKENAAEQIERQVSPKLNIKIIIVHEDNRKHFSN